MNQLLHSENQKKRPDQFIQDFGEVLLHTHAQRPVEGTLPGVMNFAEYLHAARTALPYSHDEFALRLGLNEAQLVAMEQGLLPRAAISGELLRRIAHLVDEEEEILLLILDGTAPQYHHQPVVKPLWPDSYSLGRQRPRFTALLTNYVEKQNWTGNHYLFWLFSPILVWSSLFSRIWNNGLDAARNWRLGPTIWSGLSSLHLPRAATALFALLLIYWLVVDANDPELQLLSIRNQQSANTTAAAQIVAVDTSTNRAPVRPQATSAGDHRTDSYTARSQWSENQAFVTEANPSTAFATASTHGGSGNVRSIYPSYEIIYASPSSLIDAPAQAYIEVNDQEFAVIQFLTSTTISSRRCVSSGRFDLCPI